MQSMPVRLVSELGVVAALLIVVLLFDRRFVFLYAVTLYVYVQFDSYAFYTLWIHVFFAKILRRADGWRDVHFPEPREAAP